MSVMHFFPGRAQFGTTQSISEALAQRALVPSIALFLPKML